MTTWTRARLALLSSDQFIYNIKVKSGVTGKDLFIDIWGEFSIDKGEGTKPNAKKSYNSGKEMGLNTVKWYWSGLSNPLPEGRMRPRSACNVAQCNFLFLKKFQSFKLHCWRLRPGHVTMVGEERGKEGRSGRGGERGAT